MSGTPAVPDASLSGVASAPLVEFRDLTVSYGSLVALSGVTGAFPPGPTGLLGPNGAGKTTLLKTLLGFLRPDAGRLVAFGLDPATSPLEVRRRIGYMPEVDCHIPSMTAAAFVAFAGELSGMPRDEAISRSHEVLYYVGLGEARYRAVDTYSTGMKQRAKLAQALVHDPDLLLLDEPTNGLDPQGREEMLALIQDISRRRQMSLILCSHLLRDVEQVCENVIVFNQGKVAARGPIAALTGPRRSVYDVRLKGDAAGFLRHRPRAAVQDGAAVGGAGPLLAPGRGEPRRRVPARPRARGAVVRIGAASARFTRARASGGGGEAAGGWMVPVPPRTV